MQITHDEARKLIHFDSDDALKPHESSELQTHLETCEECQAYTNSIKGMEAILRPILQRKWNQQPIPHLLLTTVLAKNRKGISQGTSLATRIVVIGIICMGFVFSVWQFTVSSQPTPTALLVSVPPVPTPSTQFMSATSMFDQCEGRPYVVRESDTLDSIALQFSVTQQDIKSMNDLGSATLQKGQEIRIPICTSTPTGTVDALTTTYTPFMSPITSTPGG